MIKIECKKKIKKGFSIKFWNLERNFYIFIVFQFQIKSLKIGKRKKGEGSLFSISSRVLLRSLRFQFAFFLVLLTFPQVRCFFHSLFFLFKIIFEFFLFLILLKFERLNVNLFFLVRFLLFLSKSSLRLNVNFFFLLKIVSFLKKRTIVFCFYHKNCLIIEMGRRKWDGKIIDEKEAFKKKVSNLWIIHACSHWSIWEGVRSTKPIFKYSSDSKQFCEIMKKKEKQN